MTQKTQTALITGASSGIGKELSYLFAQDGHNLVLVARRSDLLSQIQKQIESIHKVKVWTIALDLSDPDSTANLMALLKKLQVEVDILVNNAGFGMRTLFSEMNPHDLESMINLNILTLTKLTRELLPKMIERGHGQILNVASVASFIPGPYMGVYYATKSYVLSFTEALAFELNGKGIKVSALCPGATDTEFQDVAKITIRKNLVSQSYLMSARQVALAAHSGLRKSVLIIVPGVVYKIFVFVCRFGPRFLIKKFIYAINHPGNT